MEHTLTNGLHQVVSSLLDHYDLGNTHFYRQGAHFGVGHNPPGQLTINELKAQVKNIIRGQLADHNKVIILNDLNTRVLSFQNPQDFPEVPPGFWLIHMG